MNFVSREVNNGFSGPTPYMAPADKGPVFMKEPMVFPCIPEVAFLWEKLIHPVAVREDNEFLPGVRMRAPLAARTCCSGWDCTSNDCRQRDPEAERCKELRPVPQAYRSSRHSRARGGLSLVPGVRGRYDNHLHEKEKPFMIGRLCMKLVVSVLFVFTFLAASAIPAAADPASVIQDLNQAYVQIAEKVSPAVVNISSTRKAPASAGEDMEPFFKNFPFHQFFGDDMFKQFKRPPRSGGPAQVAMGSGFILSSDGLIMTNAHVVKDMEQITVTLPGKKDYKAKLLGSDPESDIALIKIDAKDLPTVAWGDSSKLRVGEIVIAVGNPFGLSGTVTSGIVSATGRTNVGIIDYEDFIQTDAPINPGNSGGPLINIQGKVVGITTAIATRSGGYMGVGFAIPSNSAKLVMEELTKYGKVKRGLLGVNIQDLNESLAKSFGKTDVNGALVAQVVPGSPAEKAGIKPGDIIVEFNNKPISGAAELKNLVGQTEPGHAAKLKIFRDKKTIDVDVSISERTAKAAAAVGQAATPEVSKEFGVTLEALSPEAASQLGLKPGEGIRIKEVSPDGQGARIGLKAGDVILDADGKPVADVAGFSKDVAEAKKNGIIRLKIQRDSATIYVGATLE